MANIKLLRPAGIAVIKCDLQRGCNKLLKFRMFYELLSTGATTGNSYVGF